MSDTVTQQPTLYPSFGFGERNDVHVSGLEALSHSNQTVVKQIRPECLELLNCWEFQNKYKIIDENGDQLYFLKEESSCCMRWCCGQARALSVSFQDNQGNEILRFERPLRCLGCCSDCCYPNLTQLLEIFHKDKFLGRVREVPVCCTRKNLKYSIKMMKKYMIFQDLVAQLVAEVLWIFKSL